MVGKSRDDTTSGVATLFLAWAGRPDALGSRIVTDKNGDTKVVTPEELGGGFLGCGVVVV